MRDRSSVVIIEHNKVVLIRRNRNGSIYYVFPGGGIERGEDPKYAAKREALEELGVEVKVSDCLTEAAFEGNTQYFFLAEIIGGILGTGQGEEYTDETRGRGTYQPIWIDIQALTSLDVRPIEVALNIQSLFRPT